MNRPRSFILTCAAAALFLSAASLSGQEARTQADSASLDRLLANFATWDGGVASEARWALRDHVLAHRGDPAAREQIEAALVRYLSGKATGQAKMEAARHLRAIAGEKSVGPLAALLRDQRTADYAIYVLQQVPGEAADQAMLAALSARRTALPIRKALVASLGQRRSAAAVPALSALVTDRDLAAAAITSLGRIGDPAARDALTAAWPKAAAPLRGVLASALLFSAEHALESNDPAAALRVYEMLAGDTALPAPIRGAALIGRIDASGPARTRVLVEMLGGGDEAARGAAIARLREVITADTLEPVCALLPRLPEASKVQLLAALGTYPAERVRPAVLQAARNETGAVRVAALKALGRTGSASEVAFLTELAASARGDEQAAARDALASLKGPEADAAIVSALDAKPAPALEAELLQAVAARRIFVAKPAVAARLAAPASPRVLREALRTLRSIGTPSDIPAVLDVLLAASQDDVIADAEQTVNALASKMAAVNRRAMPVRMRLRTEKEPAARARLLAVLPLTADGSALAELRTAMRDPSPEVSDAAVRAIAAWPTASAYDDVMQVARESKDETHRLLAIQALIRMLTLDTSRRPDSVVGDLRAVAGMASRPEERRLVLGALAQFPGPEALEAARSFLSDASVKAEAEAAVESINKQMTRPWFR
ncbi:MAG TPA: HEAT repeat domain-containing protein [Vicinamibacterales bacterium]|nr:HEAT repeat domain-containing protein [Vicinamibacterales bacterium]